jgi:hypothetical protein
VKNYFKDGISPNRPRLRHRSEPRFKMFAADRRGSFVRGALIAEVDFHSVIAEDLYQLRPELCALGFLEAFEKYGNIELLRNAVLIFVGLGEGPAINRFAGSARLSCPRSAWRHHSAVSEMRNSQFRPVPVDIG